VVNCTSLHFSRPLEPTQESIERRRALDTIRGKILRLEDVERRDTSLRKEAVDVFATLKQDWESGKIYQDQRKLRIRAAEERAERERAAADAAINKPVKRRRKTAREKAVGAAAGKGNGAAAAAVDGGGDASSSSMSDADEGSDGGGGDNENTAAEETVPAAGAGETAAA
jgi:hypothetical protein